jgi:ATP-dependent helicase/nuclease subunit A
MADNKIKWTKQQLRVVNARDSDVLVTASAGTGKTAVLSGRICSIISEKTNIRNMLVLTFTEAAAEQMRSRIAEQLKDALTKTPGNHLRYQLILLQGAEISTIHSFCKRIITEHFYKIGLDPTFRVIDEDQQKLLKAEALEDTIEKAWQQSSIRDAMEQLLYGRNLNIADGFPSVIIGLSDYLDGVVSRNKWYERAEELIDIINPFTSGLGEKQKQVIDGQLSDVLKQLHHARHIANISGAEIKWSQKFDNTHIEPVKKLIGTLKAEQWEQFVELISNYDKPTTYKPKGISECAAELVHRISKNSLDMLKELSQFAVLNPQYNDIISGTVSLQTKVLIELVRMFEQSYTQAKRAINCLDFADLEHYALKLLTTENSSDQQPEPSETALVLRKRFQHIFVDEYQDINSVQRLILQMLSPGGNVLHVGDVKQSIYAFRGSQPDIFLQQLKAASSANEAKKSALLVELNTNFRSVKGILDFTNKIFSRMMTTSFGGIEYDEPAMLRPPDGENSQVIADNKPVVEFHILDQISNDHDSEDDPSEELSEDNSMASGLVTARRYQAAMIAKRIRQMTGADTGKAEFQIFDKTRNTYKDVQYGDIVILMRSLAGKANEYVEVLRLAGVPVSCKAAEGYFQATEVNDCLSLLKVLDNPQRDIEIAAVLRSPLFKISDTELAKIKIFGRQQQQQGGFYNCILNYCKCGTEIHLADKLRNILNQLEQWRSLSREGRLADLIWQIYRQTGYLSFVCALLNGRSRKANLLELHERAMQFEDFAGGTGSLCLKRFVDFLEDIKEAGQDWAPAEPQNSVGNAIRILSVHKSKGLEFPVVFLAELQTEFNKKDSQSDCLISADNTVGLRIIDRRSHGKISSLAHQVIAEQKRISSLEEELRILYVAITRAKDRLILTASERRETCRQIISNGFFFGDGTIPHWQLREARNPLEWILYALSDQKMLHQAFETPLTGRSDDSNLFCFKLHNKTDLDILNSIITEQKNRKSKQSGTISKPTAASKNTLNQVKKALNWSYPFSEVSILPAKQSVSELTHRNDEYVKFDYSASLSRQPRAILSMETDKNKKIEQKVIGSATHLVISHLDFSEPVTTRKVINTVEKLILNGSISIEVANNIKIDSIVDFFISVPGLWALDRKNTVYCEWPFTFALPACELSDSLKESMPKSNELIVVQGIIDMLIRTPEGLIVIDFKTDNIGTSQVSQRAELYRNQLNLYGRAAAAIIKSQITAKWLYFLTPAVAYNI